MDDFYPRPPIRAQTLPSAGARYGDRSRLNPSRQDPFVAGDDRVERYYDRSFPPRPHFGREHGRWIEPGVGTLHQPTFASARSHAYDDTPEGFQESSVDWRKQPLVWSSRAQDIRREEELLRKKKILQEEELRRQEEAILRRMSEMRLQRARTNRRRRSRPRLRDDDVFDNYEEDEPESEPEMGRPRRIERYYYDDSATDSGESDSDSDSLDLLNNLGSELDSMLATVLDTEHPKEGLPLGSRNYGSQKPTIKHHRPIPGYKSSNIYDSEYTGDGYLDGIHSVRLSASEDSMHAQKCLFRWIHIEEHSRMDFSSFQKQVLDIHGLAEEEKHCILRIFARVSKKHVPRGESKKHDNKSDTVIEQSYLEEPLTYDKKERDNNERKVVRFWSMPYLYLGKYSGISSSSRTSSKPMPTLLQTRFAGATEARDGLQASCQVLDKESPLCFHIPQLWCMTIDRHLLVTCAQISQDVLRGDLVSLKVNPQAPTIDAYISVSYGQNTVWRLRLDDCRTWLGLLSHFWEFWPNDFRIYSFNKSVKSQDWSKLYAIAVQSGKLDLSFQIGPSRSFKLEQHLGMTMSRLGDLAPEVESLSIDSQSRQPPSYLHILQFLSSRNAGDLSPQHADSQSANQGLDRSLRRIDQYLGQISSKKSSRGPSDVRSYQQCPSHSHRDLQQLLIQQYIQMNSSQDAGVKQDIVHRCTEILAITEALFQLFLPLNASGSCISKYWGAVYRLIEANSLLHDWDSIDQHDLITMEHNLADIKSVLDTAAQRSSILLDILSLVSIEDTKLFNLPDRLVKAWTNLVLALVHLKPFDLDDRWQTHIKQYALNMDASTTEVAFKLPRKQLLPQSIVLPIDIGLLLTFRALQDITGDEPDVTEVYSRYVAQLDDEINEDSSQRIYQQSLLLLKQEVQTLKSTVHKQYEVINAILRGPKSLTSDNVRPRMAEAMAIDYPPKETYENGPQAINLRLATVKNINKTAAKDKDQYYNARALKFFGSSEDTASLVNQISATDLGGLREIFGKECRDLVIRRQAFFDAVMEQVDHLDLLNDRKFTASADRRELAIYAFSIVTVLFLPLGTVAGVFGINTNDMRNLEQGQWLFWSVATPLSITIIIGGLLWAGELGNVWQGFWSWFTRSRKSRLGRPSGYAPRAHAIADLDEDEMRIREPRLSVPAYPIPVIPSRRRAYAYGDEEVAVQRERPRWATV